MKNNTSDDQQAILDVCNMVISNAHVFSADDVSKAEKLFAETKEKIIKHEKRQKKQYDGPFKIIRISSMWNPHPDNRYFSDSYNKTGLMTDIDYTIEGLENILEEKSIKNSKRIWETLSLYGEWPRSKMDDEGVCRGGGGYFVQTFCDKATYASNGSSPVYQYPSTLVCRLRDAEWLPDKTGRLFKPCDILKSELHDDFIFSVDNLLMRALEIGSNRSAQ